MDLIDAKYINLLSSRLLKFKKVKADLYNFRCPICGDSQKNKNKTRGYLYAKKNNTNYKCHNCGLSTTLNNFIKELDPVLHKEYTLEKFKDGHSGRGTTVSEPNFVFEKPKFNASIFLPLCSEVESARTYLQDRKINPSKFYYADDFSEFVKTFRKPEYKNLYKEPRIIIPLYKNKDLIGFQGRALNSNSIKYITIMLDDDAPKIYGLDKVDETKSIYIVEGPFDSTFIKNSVAMCGSDADIRSFNWRDYIWVLDNEPRNREIVNRIAKLIERGDKVVIWPNEINEKDINDMVLSGLDVQSMIELNTYSGLEAKLKFTIWKKV